MTINSLYDYIDRKMGSDRQRPMMFVQMTGAGGVDALSERSRAMANLVDAQRMVLQAVLDLPKDAAGYVTEIQLARSTRFEESNVRDLLATLNEEGYVDLAPTTEGLSVSISARGRLALKLSHLLASTSSSPPAWLEISHDLDDARGVELPSHILPNGAWHSGGSIYRYFRRCER